MEELLAHERAAEQNVHYYLNSKDEPIVGLLQALEEYRQISRTLIFADFESGGAKREAALWHAHTEGKRYFHRALSGLRKQQDVPVATRHLIKLYLQFIKDSQRFYREYIHQLGQSFGGIPELEAIAQQVKNDGLGESSQSSVTPDLRNKVLYSCHQALIYLGDLSRYRASERLDKSPDFGPAIGYYGLACSLRPASGMGHHQLAVIALEQRQHMRAIYHLYRAIVVEDPHPNAANNLKLEFDKTNAAWDRGELIERSVPNDPDSSKRTLVGWFVRLHSMCYKGEPFRGYEELEREIQGQLANELKLRPIDSTLTRMLIVNLAAQYNAGEKFQANPIQQNHNSFIHFFRFNVKTFTTLLRVFYDDLRTADMTVSEGEDDEVNLATRLTDVVRRVLPALRLYSSWLLCVAHLLAGLAAEPMLKDAIDQFWTLYAKAVDLVASVFPIWDLEDLTEISYLLKEDTETVGFKPLIDQKTNRIWCDQATSTTKQRFHESGVVRASLDEEHLARIRDFLIDGLYLANDDDEAPIKLRGTRVLHRDAKDPEQLPFVPPTQPKQVIATNAGVVLPPKPLSYAAAAASRAVQPSARARAPKTNGSSAPPSAHSRDAQLSRMVDDLVDDDDSNTPVTPPQHHSSNPAVVHTTDVSHSALRGSASDNWRMPKYPLESKQRPIGTPPASSPSIRMPKNRVAGTPKARLDGVSNIWDNARVHQSSAPSSFPAGLPTGTLGSPAQLNSRGHSRVNSASSVRSRTSQNMGIADSWSSLDSAPRFQPPSVPNAGFAAGNTAFDQSAVASPLLFGAGGIWGTSTRHGLNNITPPNGQGG